MSSGAKIARGKWLLFTDADTVHKPGSLAKAVTEAEEQKASLLSYSPEQEVHSFWEKAVMPMIFAELAATYPPKKVNDPTSPIAAANGQYLLISREAYDAVGGHTKIANDLLEDVAMARLVKCSGRKIFFRYGGDAVRTRMYRSFGATPRRLDEEPRAPVSPSAHPGIPAHGRVSPDRRQFIRRDLGQALRPPQPRHANGAAYNHSLRLVRDANSEGALFGRIESGGGLRIARVFVPACEVG